VLVDRYEAAAAALRPTASPQPEAEAFPPINRTRQQLIAAQLAVFLAEGQKDALVQYLDRQLADIDAEPADGWRIEALSLSFALQDTARRQLEQEYDPRTVQERIGRLHDCRNKSEAYVWLKQETERFLATYQAWQQKYDAGAITRAVRYMKEHYAEPLPLQQVASHVHLNAAYFSHLFKKETGSSFVNYLIELRMERAKQLLACTAMNVTEVAGTVGYDLPNYFAKLFKQSTGFSPKEYRRQKGGPASDD
jgi:two-component system response regulator YesN